PISVKEFHLLEAVNLKKKHNKNTAGSIANYLGITIGSLSTAVKTLKKKELIEGVKNTDDKRKLYLFLTKNGEEANEYHQNFHKKMINEIKEELTEEETELMAHTLFKLHKYFGKF
ncbi:MAG: MarR family transcriptional regulator, partial [Oscillospiraceae bacterium]